MKIIISETLLIESRIDFLKKQYIDSKKVEDTVFKKFISADPTTNKEYVEWLIKIFLNGDLKVEDLYKATEYLTIYHKIKNKIQGSAKNIYAGKTEKITYIDDFDGKTKTKNETTLNIGSLQELFSLISPYKEQRADLTNYEKLRQDTFIGETSNWEIYSPKTHEQSCQLGTNTEWCTATGKTDKYFKYYTGVSDHTMEDYLYQPEFKNAKLYIFIEKSGNKRKYQMHVRQNGVMGDFNDQQDKKVEISTVIKNEPELLEFLINKDILSYTELVKDGVITKICENSETANNYIMFLAKNNIFNCTIFNKIMGRIENYALLLTPELSKILSKNKCDNPGHYYVDEKIAFRLYDIYYQFYDVLNKQTRLFYNIEKYPKLKKFLESNDITFNRINENEIEIHQDLKTFTIGVGKHGKLYLYINET